MPTRRHSARWRTAPHTRCRHSRHNRQRRRLAACSKSGHCCCAGLRMSLTGGPQQRCSQWRWIASPGCERAPWLLRCPPQLTLSPDAAESVSFCFDSSADGRAPLPTWRTRWTTRPARLPRPPGRGCWLSLPRTTRSARSCLPPLALWPFGPLALWPFGPFGAAHPTAFKTTLCRLVAGSPQFRCRHGP